MLQGQTGVRVARGGCGAGVDKEVGEGLWGMSGSCGSYQKVSKHAIYCTSLWALKDEKDTFCALHTGLTEPGPGHVMPQSQRYYGIQ